MHKTSCESSGIPVGCDPITRVFASPLALEATGHWHPCRGNLIQPKIMQVFCGYLFGCERLAFRISIWLKRPPTPKERHSCAVKGQGFPDSGRACAFGWLPFCHGLLMPESCSFIVLLSPCVDVIGEKFALIVCFFFRFLDF